MAKIIEDMKWIHGPKFLLFPRALWPDEPEHQHLEKEYLSHYQQEYKETKVQMVSEKAIPVLGRVSTLAPFLLAHALAIRWLSDVKDGRPLYENPQASKNEVSKALQQQRRAKSKMLDKVRAAGRDGRTVSISVGEDPLRLTFQARDLDSALLRLIKQEQLELPEASTNGSKLQRALAHQKAFTDDQGLIRVGGRLATFGNLEYDFKHPIVLVPKTALTFAIVKNFHEIDLKHSFSENALIEAVSGRFWLHGISNVAKNVIKQCNQCLYLKTKPFVQEMLDVHVGRGEDEPTPAFNGQVNIDVMGPIVIKQDGKLKKKYVLIIVCGFSRACHLESLDDLTTKETRLAMERFTIQKGEPHTIVSDKGTNFEGCCNQLRREGRLDGSGKTSWKFVPPGTPHFNGSVERLIGVIKNTLFKSPTMDYRRRKFTTSEWLTFIKQCEALLNTRPLLTDNSETFGHKVLTPNDFLGLGKGRKLSPRPDEVLDLNKKHAALYQELTEVWKRFKREYLPTLRQCSKWLSGEADLRVGDVVLVLDQRIRPQRAAWPRAVVVDISTKRSGSNKKRLINQVRVKLAHNNKEVTKDIRHLAPLTRRN